MVNLKSIIWVFTWRANRLNTPKKKTFRMDWKKQACACYALNISTQIESKIT